MLVLSCGLAWKLVSWFLCSYQSVVQTRTLTRPQPADSGTSAAPGGPQETVRKRQSQVKAMSLRLWSAFVRPGFLRRNYCIVLVQYYCTLSGCAHLSALPLCSCGQPALRRCAASSTGYTGQLPGSAAWDAGGCSTIQRGESERGLARATAQVRWPNPRGGDQSSSQASLAPSA